MKATGVTEGRVCNWMQQGYMKATCVNEGKGC